MGEFLRQIYREGFCPKAKYALINNCQYSSSRGAFNNYVDKKRWVGGQYKFHARSCEQSLGISKNVHNCSLEGGGLAEGEGGGL